MRKAPPIAATLLLLTGCVDATGILNDCSGEMTGVRVENGQPNDSHREESRGDFIETWDYFDLDRRFIFRWGVSYDGCQVTRTRLNLVPEPTGQTTR